jgi:hypothetical protein
MMHYSLEYGMIPQCYGKLWFSAMFIHKHSSFIIVSSNFHSFFDNISFSFSLIFYSRIFLLEQNILRNCDNLFHLK